MDVGLVLGIQGLIMSLLAYPVYKGITGSRKKKYEEQLMLLRDEINGEAR